jgi:hypothetical protein
MSFEVIDINILDFVSVSRRCADAEVYHKFASFRLLDQADFESYVLDLPARRITAKKILY